jgi:hypothetical protein
MNAAHGSFGKLTFPRAIVSQPGIHCKTVTSVQITKTSASDPGLIIVKPAPVYDPFAMGVCDPSWNVSEHDDGDKEPVIHSVRQFVDTICYTDNKKQTRKTISQFLQTVARSFRGVRSNVQAKLRKLDPIKMSYLRTSSIFAAAVLVTWIPSSVNRLYSLGHHGRINFGLSIASGCVLPLQGVWNAIIYFTTS